MYCLFLVIFLSLTLRFCRHYRIILWWNRNAGTHSNQGYAAATLWQWAHIDHTPGSLKSNAKCKTAAEFNVQMFGKH